MLAYRLTAALSAFSLLGAVQAEGVKLPRLALDLGVYLPTDRELRDIFGGSFFVGGIGLARSEKTSSGLFGPSISAISASRDGNRFLLVPVRIGYQYIFPQSTENQVSYFRAMGGAAYYDYAITRASGVRFTGRRAGATAALEMGMIFNQKWSLGFQYNWFQDVDRFNFNGFRISAGMKF